MIAYKQRFFLSSQILWLRKQIWKTKLTRFNMIKRRNLEEMRKKKCNVWETGLFCYPERFSLALWKLLEKRVPQIPLKLKRFWLSKQRNNNKKKGKLADWDQQKSPNLLKKPTHNPKIPIITFRVTLFLPPRFISSLPSLWGFNFPSLLLLHSFLWSHNHDEALRLRPTSEGCSGPRDVGRA